MNPIKQSAAIQSTDVLLGALLILDAKSSLTNEERMVEAAMADVLTERHDLDADIEAIYMADDYEGSHTEALLVALAASEAA